MPRSGHSQPDQTRPALATSGQLADSKSRQQSRLFCACRGNTRRPELHSFPASISQRKIADTKKGPIFIP
ncbi:MAG: hypothetical protein Hals2KO_13840 [Halioglobus sp.]